MSNQYTIKKSISGFGVGIHSGENVVITFLPAEANTGIIFRKKDKFGNILAEIPARYDAVCSTVLCTSISSKDNKHKINTIEHLMAALWGCGIDNMIIEIDHDEVPIMDGSSEQFVFMIECAGKKLQPFSRQIIEILEEVKIEENGAYAILSPSSNFALEVEIDFHNKVIGNQKYNFYSDFSNFKMEIARARTFGFEHEIKKLHELGLARGGSLDNAIVVGENNILNSQGLRYADEFARHKLLDCIGDLYLSGKTIKGHYKGYKCGHAINNKLLKILFANENSWRIIEAPIKQNSAA